MLTTSIATAGAALALFLAAVLSAKRATGTPDAFLLGWLVVQCAFFLCVVLATSGASDSAWLLIGAQLLLFAAAPAQYSYAAASLGWRNRWHWHAAAAAGVALLLAVPPMVAKLIHVQAGALVAEGAPRWLFLVPLCATALVAAYPFTIWRRTQATERFSEGRSSGSQVAGDWIGAWALTTLGAAISQVMGVVLAFAGATNPTWQIAFALAAQVLSIAYVGYRGILSPGVFSLVSVRAARPKPPASDDPAADYRVLLDACADKKPHTSPELTAAQLADLLGWAPERLTLALKSRGITFFDFVNELRVAQLKSILRDERNREAGLLGLAHEAGFGSKTALYDAFNRHVGMSPARWRSSLRERTETT